MNKQRVLVSWSSGKDAAWALYQAKQSSHLEVVGVFTTVNNAFQRVAMHGVRREVLERQAECLGLPLFTIDIPYPCSNEDYENAMSQFIDEIKSDGIDGLVFGDLFLEDIRDYREKQLADSGLSIHFPLWEIPTDELAKEMVSSGLQAVIACVDPKQCSSDLAGRIYDADLLSELPKSMDPCGENGEFHTCVVAGPMFKQALQVRVGEIVEREGFVYADVLLLGDG